jgi:hypothetical protein
LVAGRCPREAKARTRAGLSFKIRAASEIAM